MDAWMEKERKRKRYKKRERGDLRMPRLLLLHRELSKVLSL